VPAARQALGTAVVDEAPPLSLGVMLPTLIATLVLGAVSPGTMSVLIDTFAGGHLESASAVYFLIAVALASIWVPHATAVVLSRIGNRRMGRLRLAVVPIALLSTLWLLFFAIPVAAVAGWKF
jgi:hypothetical protein